MHRGNTPKHRLLASRGWSSPQERLPSARGIQKQSQLLHSWHTSHTEISRQRQPLLGQAHLPASQPIPGASLETNSTAASDFHCSQHCASSGQGLGSLPELSNGHSSPVASTRETALNTCLTAHRQYPGAAHHSQERIQKGQCSATTTSP